MIKKIFTLYFASASYFLSAQLDLYNSGGGLTFYVGQSHIVQAEGNFDNAASATIQFENGGTPDFRLKGNFTNSTSGTYTLGTEKIRFNGSSLQLADFGGDDIYGIYTDNSNNVQIDRNVNVTGDVEFGTGDIISTTSAYITIGTSGTATGADDDSHNFGPIAKNFTSTSEFTFPIGDGTTYRYSAFTPTSASSVTMRSMYYGSKYPFSMRRNSPIYKVSQLEYWDMYRTSGSTTGTVKLSWDTNSDVSDVADMSVAFNNGTSTSWWEDAGSNSPTGTTSAGYVSSNATWDDFNVYFTLATTTADNPLPVELVKFLAAGNGTTVDILWQTSAEINSDYFSVLKSTDGVNFEEIAQVPAAGRSNSLIDYSSIDTEPIIGTNYYKLVNYDFDGTFEESDVKVVYYAGEDEGEFSANIYPNPVNSEANFDFIAAEEGKYSLKIFSINGAMVYTSDLLAVQGLNSFKLNMDLYYSGKYIVQIISPKEKVITSSIKKI